ncbi:hypothetical protein C0J52_00993 [Blattella germanica]|nr:hypothetical protein C0J52_00993 [Blattella germanica]
MIVGRLKKSARWRNGVSRSQGGNVLFALAAPVVHLHQECGSRSSRRRGRCGGGRQWGRDGGGVGAARLELGEDLGEEAGFGIYA